jgi:hypothetical protein
MPLRMPLWPPPYRTVPFHTLPPLANAARDESPADTFARPAPAPAATAAAQTHHAITAWSPQ